jgi:hypothetical protein
MGNIAVQARNKCTENSYEVVRYKSACGLGKEISVFRQISYRLRE